MKATAVTAWPRVCSPSAGSLLLPQGSGPNDPSSQPISPISGVFDLSVPRVWMRHRSCRGEDMARTTPPRPFNVAAELPDMAGLARTAIRLHPRPGAPTVHDSSAGGPLLWPAEEPWPVRTPAFRPRGRLSTLADIRTRRDMLTDAWARPRGPRENLLTKQEQEINDRITAGHPPELMPEGPLPLIPVAQLYARDVPVLSFPERTDLLQILWAPFDDIEGCSDAVQLRWRRRTSPSVTPRKLTNCTAANAAVPSKRCSQSTAANGTGAPAAGARPRTPRKAVLLCTGPHTSPPW